MEERFFMDINVQVSNNFTEVVSDSDAISPGVLSVRFKAECDEDLYGPDCDISCVPRDDENGHFACDVQGSRVCLRGYCEEVGNSCIQECDECAENPCLNGGTCTVSHEQL